MRKVRVKNIIILARRTAYCKNHVFCRGVENSLVYISGF